MDITRARSLALEGRRNIGILLNQLKKIKETPDNFSPDAKAIRYRLLSANLLDVRGIYQTFPEIKPIRVRQLNLFTKVK